MKISLKSTDRVTICGMPGTGKTTYMRSLLRGYPEVYVYDPLDQYRDFPRHVPLRDNIEDFEAVCKRIWEKGNICFAVEESEMYFPQGKPLTPWAARIVLRGRNRGIGVIANTRRLAMLSKNFFSLCEHVFIFRLFSPNDISYLSAFIGDEPSRGVREMPDWAYVHYSGNLIHRCPPLRI